MQLLFCSLLALIPSILGSELLPHAHIAPPPHGDGDHRKHGPSGLLGHQPSGSSEDDYDDGGSENAHIPRELEGSGASGHGDPDDLDRKAAFFIRRGKRKFGHANCYGIEYPPKQVRFCSLSPL